jgi:hypothetical protein
MARIWREVLVRIRAVVDMVELEEGWKRGDIIESGNWNYSQNAPFP